MGPQERDTPSRPITYGGPKGAKGHKSETTNSRRVIGRGGRPTPTEQLDKTRTQRAARGPSTLVGPGSMTHFHTPTPGERENEADTHRLRQPRWGTSTLNTVPTDTIA
jgi:hypothetical protein